MKLLPAVMVRAPRQQENVNRWLAYSRSLNPKYEITVLDAPVEAESSKIPQDAAFRYVLDKYAGTAFLWLEPDSIPIPGKKDWLEQITAAYRKCGKAFMLPRLENPGDIGSGIGVYPPEASWLIPKTFAVHAWDAWVYRNLQGAIHFTDLIQHSYGEYDGMYMTRRHAFPKDQRILKEKTVLFHSDPTQTLIRDMPVMYHTGDIGDLIAALPILKHIGGGAICLGPIDPSTPVGKIPRHGFDDLILQHFLTSFLQQQSYVTDIYWSKDKQPDWYDLSLFRLLSRNKDENLLQWQARAIGLPPLSENQWITCGSYMTHDRILAARSLRYHNPFFPWKAIANFYGNKLLFIGLPEEHLAFQEVIGREVELANTPTLLDMAKLVMGASIGYYNQSAPYWLAAGLAKTLVQESWVGGELNAIVKRPNASYITSDLAPIAKLLRIQI